MTRLTPGAVSTARPVAEVSGQTSLFGDDVPPVAPAGPAAPAREGKPVYRMVQQLAPRLAEVTGSSAFHPDNDGDKRYEQLRAEWLRIAKRLVARYTGRDLTAATDDQLQRVLRADARGRKVRI